MSITHYQISQRTTEESLRITEANYAALKLCEPLCFLCEPPCNKKNYTEKLKRFFLNV